MTPDSVMKDESLSHKEKLARMRKLVRELPKHSKAHDLAVEYCLKLYRKVLD